jgi:prevent-host-death family protein
MSTAAEKRKPKVISSSEAQNRIGYYVSRAAYDGVRTIIERRGEQAAVIVPISDLAILEQHDRTAA